MVDVSVVLAIVGSFMTLISIAIAFLTFYFNRKKDSGADGEWRGELRADLQHIKSGVDDLRKDNDQIKEDVKILRERTAVNERDIKSAHRRIDSLERREE